VVYGLVGLKTHAKMALVVRKEQDTLRRYVHLGTGNYNPVTARIYTDVSLLTCREDIANDAIEVFNFLTGYSNRDSYRKLAVAPVTLRERITELIDREIQHARQGREARMVLKMNSLTDEKMIEKLYEASRTGVRIEMIIRGVCCLRPGIKGVSDNVRVLSIVGRFLEHSRVFYFLNGGSSELYLSSADLMGRNLNRRVELMFPVENPSIAEEIRKEILDSALEDTAGTWVLQSDGKYTKLAPPPGVEPSEAQRCILRSRAERPRATRPVPRESP
jgi:polyphosphate kinase